MSVRIETNIGSFVVDLFTNDAPKTTFNFLKLCKLNYYAYSIFLRCEPNFLLQGGDPTNSGSGGESIWKLLDPKNESLRFFADEIDVKRHKHLIRGTISMANAGKNKNASQFFITLADDLDFLDETCTVFGQLISFSPLGKGDENALESEEFFEYFNNDVFCDESHRPLQDVYVVRTTVLTDPFPDPEGLDSLASSTSRTPSKPTASFLKHRRIGAEESLDDMKGRSEAEIEAERRVQAAKSDALVLEMLGDLPHADVKPPENVLFICKLNPITRSEDLKMIFSRFGAISSCEVIKDRDTDASLGYAFIEFDEKSACEQAYLKMDGVLVDDRRVRVDFSQSVAKLHQKWNRERSNRPQRDGSRDANRSSRDRRHRSRSRDRYSESHRRN